MGIDSAFRMLAKEGYYGFMQLHQRVQGLNALLDILSDHANAKEAAYTMQISQTTNWYRFMLRISDIFDEVRESPERKYPIYSSIERVRQTSQVFWHLKVFFILLKTQCDLILLVCKMEEILQVLFTFISSS